MIASAAEPTRYAESPASPAEPAYPPDALADRVRAALAGVEDPEIPIALVDLGVVRDVRVSGDSVHLVLSPTRLGCPALGEIARRLSAAAAAVPGVVDVQVQWRPRAWSPADVSLRGQAALRAAGYTLRTVGVPADQCPYCGSQGAEPLGTFGGSVCRQSLLCSTCGSPYDALRSAACTADALGGTIPAAASLPLAAG